MAYKRNPVGRPPKYKSVEEIQGKIDAYFTACKGHPLMNRSWTNTACPLLWMPNHRR